MFIKPLFTFALCLALSPAIAFGQDDEKPAPKKAAKAAKADKKEAKEKKAPVTPRDEETALKEFKADVKKIKAWSESKGKPDPANPAAGLRLLTEMAEKISAVRTDSLPEDLAKPFAEMNALIGKMAGFFEGAPKEDEEFQTWLVKKVADPDFLKSMQEEMPKLGAALEKKGKEMKEVAAKYGIEDLDFGDKKADKDGDEKEDDAKDKDDDDKDGKDKKDEKEEK